MTQSITGLTGLIKRHCRAVAAVAAAALLTTAVATSAGAVSLRREGKAASPDLAQTPTGGHGLTGLNMAGVATGWVSARLRGLPPTS